MYHILDEHGFYTGISVADRGEHPYYTQTPIVGNFNVFQCVNDVWQEGLTNGEILEINLEKAKALDIFYTDKISQLLKKPMEKLIIEQVPIPQSILDERDNLIAEYNQILTDLGIDKSQIKKP